MGVNGVPQQLSGLADRFSAMRTGIVQAVDPFGATVLVGETPLRAAYLREAEPSIGDTVAVLRQGATWLVLGATSASGGNAVQNASFEEADLNGFPLHWTQYNVSGTAVVSSIVDPSAIPDGGTRVLETFCPPSQASCSVFVYSEAIGVVQGQTVEASVYASGSYPSLNPNTTDVSLRLFWFANATNLYPTTSAADTTLQTINDIPDTEALRLLRGTATVPAGAVFARVALRAAMLTGAGAHFDFATFRVR